MKRMTVVVAAGVVLTMGFWGAAFAQTSAPSMPANWQDLSFQRLTMLADTMQKAGKTDDAKKVMIAAGAKVGTVTQCKGMESLAKTVLGPDATAFLAAALADHCMEDFSKTRWGSEMCYWGIDALIAGGKMEQAKSLLASTLGAVSGDFSKVYSRAKQVMPAEEAGKWFGAQLVARCKTWGAGSPTVGISSAAASLQADGRLAEMKALLEAGAPYFKTVGDCQSAYDLAKTAMKDQARAWMAGVLLQNCQTDLGNATLAQLKWALGVLTGAGKKEEAKGFLDAAGKLAKTAADRDSLKAPAVAILGAGADAWIAALLTQGGQAAEGSFAQLKESADALVASGKKDQAKAFLDLAGKAAKTLEACKSLSNSSKAVYGADSDKFLSGIIVGGCMEDFANPNVHWGSDLAYWAIDILIAGGKPDQAKQVLSSTAQNVTDKFNQVYSRAKLLMPEADAAKWLGDQIAARCQGGWKVGTPTHILPGLATMLAGEGKLAEAKKVLDAGAGFFKTLRDCGDLQTAAKAVLKDQAPAWMADVLIKNCQGDLANGTFSQLTSALQTLTAGGKKAEAKPFLDAAGNKVKTVVDCETLRAPAKAILGDAADAWIAATLQKCTPTSGKSGLSELNAAVGMLLAGGKKDEAKAMLETAGKSVKTVAECMAIGSSAKAAMGDGADPWLAGVLLQNCQADLPKCDLIQAKWAVGVLAAAGKKTEAQPFLDAAGALVKTISDCESLRVPARALLGETAAGAWLANVLLRNCQADLGRAGSIQIRAALNSLVAAGKKAEAMPFLDAAGKGAKTISDCQSLADPAKAVAGDANAWLSGILLQNCQADLGKCTFNQARWATGVLLGAGKKTEAKPFLDAAGKAVKTLADCESLKEQAKAVLGADSSAWLAGVLLQNCQAELAKGNISQLEASIPILLSAGKKDQAKVLLDSAGNAAKTLADWSSLNGPARAILGEGADAWLADILLKNCQSDLPKCTLPHLKSALATLVTAGKKTEAKPFLDAAGNLVKTIGDCESLQSPVKAVLGDAAYNQWMAALLLNCKADLTKCTFTQARWATGILVAVGKKDEAKPLLEAAGKLVKTGDDCSSLKDSAKAILGADAGAWLATILVQNCQADLAKCSFAQLKEATDALVAAGKKDQAGTLLGLASKAVKTLEACRSLNDSSKAVHGADSGKFLAGIMAAGCMEDFASPTVHWGSDLAYWAIDVLIAGGKSDQAKQVLASTAQHIPDKYNQVYSRIKLLLPDADAGKWLSDQVASRCQGDWKEGVPTRILPGVAILLAGDGKLAEGKKVLDAGAIFFKTVRDCGEIQDAAKAVLKDQAGAWMAGVLLKNCQTDLEQCPTSGAAWALGLLIPSGKIQEAKGVLEKAGSRVTTVAEVLSLEPAARSLLDLKANEWLAGVLLGRCKENFAKCVRTDAARAATILQKAGKTQEAKMLLEPAKAQVNTVRACREVVGPVTTALSWEAAHRWAAELLLSQCQDDLKTCDMTDAAWAAWMLADGNQPSNAQELLASIEAGQRAAPGQSDGKWRTLWLVARTYRVLRQTDKSQQWMMQAYQAAVGDEAARAAADVPTLKELSACLKDLGMTGKGKGYAGFAQVLIRLARDGNLAEVSGFHELALPLGTPEAIQLLQAELTDANGQPRLPVAKILAWAYRNTGDLGKWQQTLEGNIAAAKGNSDAKALWLLARAYAEALVPEEPSPLRGKKWLDDAFASADSFSLKLAALREIVLGYVNVGNAQAAQSLLDKSAGQFSSGDQAAAIDDLRKDAVSADAARLITAAAVKKGQAAERQTQYQSELQRRLADAKARGDQEAVSRYEGLLAGSN